MAREGVLTKPDMIVHRNTWGLWRDILAKRKFNVKHGYYVTKQPNQSQLDEGMTHAEARAAETEFFASQEPWTTQLASFSNRFGTLQLQRALAEKLAHLILIK